MKNVGWLRWETQASIHHLALTAEACQMPLYRYFGSRWPKTVLIFRGSDVIWSNRWEDLYQLGMEMMDFYRVPGEKENFWKDWKKVKEALNEEFSRLDKVDFGDLGDKDLLEKYEDFCRVYMRFWEVGWFDEPIAFEGERLLRESLLSAEDLSKLLTPSWVPFVAEIEKDLLLILKVCKVSTHKGELLIQKHCKKYFWKRNNYLKSFRITPGDIEEEILDLSKNVVSPGREINRLEKLKRDKSKQKYLSKLPKKLREVVAIMDEFGKHQDERKGQMMIAAFYLDCFLEEVGKRVGISLEQMRYIVHGEMADLLFKKNNFKGHIRRRMKKCAIVWDGEEYTIGYDKFVDQVENKLFGKRTGGSVVQVTGMTASVGTAVGRAVILEDPRDVDKMLQGDILIAPRTSPDYVAAIKKAGAIVTNWGGMTSHAAIVAREFGIPCVVGTDVATKVFRDGDTVEVLADEGIVRKI